MNEIIVNPEPVWEDKNWGRVWHRFYDRHCGDSFLEFIPGERCSLHRHLERANTFIVLEGEVIVERFGETPHGTCERAVLSRYDTICVPSMEWHRFRTLKPGRMVEVYFADRGGTVRMDDIERFDVGGADEL